MPREARTTAIVIAIAWLAASLWWWVATWVWTVVVENPPDGSWLLERDPWQQDALVWCNGGAAALAVGALVAAIRVRCPVRTVMLVMAVGIAAQVAGFALLRSGGVL